MEKHHHSDALDRALTDLYATEVPQAYRAAWRQTVKREEQHSMHKPQNHRAFWRAALPIAATLVLVIGALTIGSRFPTVVNDTLSPAYAPTNKVTYSTYVQKDTADTGAAPSSAITASNESTATLLRGAETTDAMESDAAAGETADSESTGAKIVRTASFTIATTAFDTDADALTSLTGELGGYIASVSVSGDSETDDNRIAYYTLRIPSDMLDTFISKLSTIGRMTWRYETATDMTTQYSDTHMRLTTQQDKLARLQELIGKAESVSDLLEIESEIADTQYQIDRLESSLRSIDRDVDNSVVSVTLTEQTAAQEAQATQLTLWQRIQSGFTASIEAIGRFLQNLLVFLAVALPVLVPLLILTLILLWVLRIRKGKGAENPEAENDAPDCFTKQNEVYTKDETTKPTDEKRSR